MRGLLVAVAVSAAACGFEAPATIDGGPPDALRDGEAPPDMQVPLGPWSPPTEVMLPLVGSLDDPSLTDDGRQLFFGYTPFGSGVDEDIWVAERASIATPWGVPTRLSMTTANDTTGRISGDGLTLLFASDRVSSDFRIYRTTRARPDDAFGNVTVVNELTEGGSDTYSPATSRDGLGLVICSNRMGGRALDESLFYAQRTTTAGSWSTPVKLDELASEEPDCDPWTPDPLTIYFVRGPLATSDIYVATRSTPSGAYGPPTLVTEVNSPVRDSDPWVSADGKTMYFASTRNGGASKIYVSTRQ